MVSNICFECIRLRTACSEHRVPADVKARGEPLMVRPQGLVDLASKAWEAGRDYGVVANVCEPDRALRMGARVWVLWSTGGTGRERFVVEGMSRSGRRIEKWVPAVRLNNYRAKWIPEPLQERVWYLRGTREDAEESARQLDEWAEMERRRRAPNRPSPPKARVKQHGETDDDE